MATWWEITFTGEPNQYDLEHVADLIKEGFTSGHLIESEPGDWEWAIVNYDGEIIDRYPTQVAAHEHLMDDKYPAGSHIEYVGEDGEG